RPWRAIPSVCELPTIGPYRPQYTTHPETQESEPREISWSPQWMAVAARSRDGEVHYPHESERWTAMTILIERRLGTAPFWMPVESGWVEPGVPVEIVESPSASDVRSHQGLAIVDSLLATP